MITSLTRAKSSVSSSATTSTRERMISPTSVLTNSTIPERIFFSSTVWSEVISIAFESSSIEILTFFCAMRRLIRLPERISRYDTGRNSAQRNLSGTAISPMTRREL